MELVLLLAAVEQDDYDNRMRLRTSRKKIRDVSNPFALSENRFRFLFSLPKVLAKRLIHELEPHIECGMRSNAIPLRTKVLAALCFYTSGSIQKGVGQDFQIGLSQTSISRCVMVVSQAINKHLANRYIKFPTTEVDREEIKRKFFEKTGFPGIIGAIDCTHVAINNPPSSVQHIYLNSKAFHSMNVQIICDYNLRILNIKAKNGGATDDAFIWQNSRALTHLEHSHTDQGAQSSWLLGDSAFPLQPWLMTPIQIPVTREQAKYNVHHRAVRSRIDRCNSVLKTRFKCLSGKRKLHYSPQMASLIINACAVLHNMMVAAEVPEPNISKEELAQIKDKSYVDESVLPESEIFTPELEQGQRIRENIIRQYFV